MKVIYSLNEKFDLPGNTAVALGTFDGVHIAHKAVIESMVSTAHTQQLTSVVYTFSNHPKELNAYDDAPKRLITPAQKIKIIESLGVDILVMVPFDEVQANMPAIDFLKNVIVKSFKAKHITVGYDFRFGKNADGHANLLLDHMTEFGYQVNIVEPITFEKEIISSTMIRNYLLNGNVESANALLGRLYCIEGVVVKGKQVGKKLGFPTINLKTDFEMSVLKPGVYVTQTDIDGILYISATNVGFNPTFDQSHFTIETFILNFDADIYAKHVKIQFLQYVRPEIKFDNIDELIQQIENDVTYIKTYFKSSKAFTNES